MIVLTRRRPTVKGVRLNLYRQSDLSFVRRLGAAFDVEYSHHVTPRGVDGRFSLRLAPGELTPEETGGVFLMTVPCLIEIRERGRQCFVGYITDNHRLRDYRTGIEICQEVRGEEYYVPMPALSRARDSNSQRAGVTA